MSSKCWQRACAAGIPCAVGSFSHPVFQKCGLFPCMNHFFCQVSGSLAWEGRGPVAAPLQGMARIEDRGVSCVLRKAWGPSLQLATRTVSTYEITHALPLPTLFPFMRSELLSLDGNSKTERHWASFWKDHAGALGVGACLSPAPTFSGQPAPPW